MIDKEFDIEIHSLLDMIREVNSYSLIDITLNKEDKNIRLNKLLNGDLKLFSKEKYQIFIDIDDEPINLNKHLFTKFFYKNQYVEKIGYLSNSFFISKYFFSFKRSSIILFIFFIFFSPHFF